MSKKKLKFLVDECVSKIPEFKRLRKSVKLVALEDVGLSHSATDVQILATGQKEKLLILTVDIGSGFSWRQIRKPTYKDTGVVISPGDYDVYEIDEAVYSLSKEVTQEDLTHARTIVTLDKAVIYTIKEGKIEIKFS